MKPIQEGHKFIAIYDQTYGSLRLPRRIIEKGILRDVVIQAHRLADRQELIEVNQPTIRAIEELINSTNDPIQSIVLGSDIEIKPEANCIRVIMPNSKGLLLTINNEEFLVHKVFYTPNGLRYEGVTPNLSGSGNTLNLLIEHVLEIPGETKIGLYNLETGRVDEIIEVSEETESIPTKQRKQIDAEKLFIVLKGYFDETTIDILCHKMNLSYKVLFEGSKEEKVRALISYCREVGTLTILLRETYLLYKKQQAIIS